VPAIPPTTARTAVRTTRQCTSRHGARAGLHRDVSPVILRAN
jgi:hypothetical protein